MLEQLLDDRSLLRGIFRPVEYTVAVANRLSPEDEAMRPLLTGPAFLPQVVVIIKQSPLLRAWHVTLVANHAHEVKSMVITLFVLLRWVVDLLILLDELEL